MWLSVIWFVGLAGGALVCAAVGRALARRSELAARRVIALSVFGVIIAAVPRFHPIFLHGTLPLDVSVWLEGVLAVFPWMALVGGLSIERFSSRLRRAAPLMFILGVVYFMFGGIWMLLPNIDLPPDEQLGPTRGSGVVWQQSRPDTCVPAACATALTCMGVQASERELCEVVQAKPARGSTLARAARGLRDYLQPRGFNVELMYLTPTELALTAEPEQPFLVIIRSGYGMDHMIAVLGVSPLGVVIANPSPGQHGSASPIDVSDQYPPVPHGIEFYRTDDFVRMLRPGAIVITPPEGWRMHVANARHMQQLKHSLRKNNDAGEEANLSEPDRQPDE